MKICHVALHTVSTSGNRVEKVWIGCNWLRYRPVVSYCEHGNESSGSIKGDEFD